MTEDPCEAMRLLVQAELDGELDAAGAAALAGHVAGCSACAGLRRELGELSSRLRIELTRHAAPPRLRQAVLAQARLQAELPRSHTRRLSWRDGGWFGAGLAVAASLALLAWVPREPGPGVELVAAHIRALQPGHLLDVVSTDRHTVKPWFDGRLDFAPPVRDFATQGYPLAGGRLDYLAGRPVAALVYRRGKHIVELFVWPGEQPGSRRTLQGYNMEAWSQDGMNYRLVSDLGSAELAAFERLLRQPG